MGVRARSVGLAACAVAVVLPAAAAAAPAEPASPAATSFVDRSARPAGAGEHEARTALERRLGPQLAVGVEPDGATRVVQRLDGALSAPSAAPRPTVARDWVRDHRDLFGLHAADVDGLSVASAQTAGASGLTTVRLQQHVDGIPVYDGGLELVLDRGGRVLSASGEPVAAAAAAAPSTRPRLDPDAARAALDASVGATTPVAPAALTLFPTAAGTRLAWTLIEQRSSDDVLSAVVDATDGTVLLRQGLTKSDAPSTFLPRYPGAQDDPALGGAAAPQDVDLQAAGYLPAGATTLVGPYARAFSDVNGNDVAEPSEEVTRATGASAFRFAFTRFSPCDPSALAPAPRCTWDPATPTSWTTNRKQTTVQTFILVNQFHDHLENPNIAFGARGFAGDDPVVVNTLDGAGLASPPYNNANMTVLPDGRSPKLQTYLFKAPFRNVDGGDDAVTVWHEYTHGLTGRLVTHSDGTSALSSIEAGALSEAWSDFYALDLLQREGLAQDTAAPGEVDLGAYTDLAPHSATSTGGESTRSQAADCPVGAAAPACPGHGGAGPGGYTLGDFGLISGHGPEVHYDGEIWLETLWDVRQALETELGSEAEASDTVERLVTDGLRLTPPEPSLIDARNAMLAADTAAGSRFHPLLWRVFAARGLGYYASVVGSQDAAPVPDSTDPTTFTGGTGTVTGRVSDAAGGLPLAGVTVSPTRPSNGSPRAVSDANGRYSLNLAAGTYPRLVLTGPAGYDTDGVPVTVTANATTTVDRTLPRDWASAAGGAHIVPEGAGAGACGSGLLIDDLDGSGWAAAAPRAGSAAPSVTIDLPVAVDVSSIVIDPRATCGYGTGSALAQYRVDAISPTGTRTMVAGTFGSGDTGPVARQPTNARDVTRLRLTALSAQSASSSVISVSDLSVRGTPSDAVPTGQLSAVPSTVLPGQLVTFRADFVDPDSVITSYGWDFDGDGTVDVTTTAPTVQTSFGQPGARNARVTVHSTGGGEGAASVGVQVLAPATSPPGVTPAPAPALPLPDPRAAPPAAPRVTVKARRRALAVGVRCSGTCRLEATGTVSAATARRLGRRSRVVLRATRTRVTRGTTTLTLPAAVRRAARAHHLSALRITVALRLDDASKRRATRRATLRVVL